VDIELLQPLIRLFEEAIAARSKDPFNQRARTFGKCRLNPRDKGRAMWGELCVSLRR
jgi:hypothetical protein